MFLISIEEEKQKQEKMLAIESDVKNVEKDIQGIQDLFRDLSKLVNVCIRIKFTFHLLLFINCALYVNTFIISIINIIFLNSYFHNYIIFCYLSVKIHLSNRIHTYLDSTRKYIGIINYNECIMCI